MARMPRRSSTSKHLLRKTGFDAVYGGGLAERWRIQRDTPGYGPRFRAGELTVKLSITRWYTDT